jgi:hypothetical protein
VKSLRVRLERLEAKMPAKRPLRVRCGQLTPLPADYVGERHVVIVKRLSNGAGGMEWCEFEERHGPAPPGSQDHTPTIYFSEDEMKF